jgi:hypothetical protein
MRRKNSWSFGVIVVVLTLSGPVPRAQAQSAEEAAVVQVVHDLFDGMREADAEKIRGVFAEGARLGGLNREGAVNYTSAEDFAMRIGQREANAVDERVWDWEVRIDGNLAQVWTKYDLLFNGEFSHCGIDAFQLFKMTDGWKIFHLADTRHTGPDCWRYPGND